MPTNDRKLRPRRRAATDNPRLTARELAVLLNAAHADVSLWAEARPRVIAHLLACGHHADRVGRLADAWRKYPTGVPPLGATDDV